MISSFNTQIFWFTCIRISYSAWLQNQLPIFHVFYHNSMAPPFDTVIFGFFFSIRFGEKRSQITFYRTRMQGILCPAVKKKQVYYSNAYFLVVNRISLKSWCTCISPCTFSHMEENNEIEFLWQNYWRYCLVSSYKWDRVRNEYLVWVWFGQFRSRWISYSRWTC